MNKQELIKKYEYMNRNLEMWVVTSQVLNDLRRLDEPEAGHADEAPRYVKNILARLRELPLHDREVWLKTIMGEFEQDFSRAKWREGYEQGKVEGLIEREKVTVPQFVADWIEKNRGSLFGLNYDSVSSEIYDWVYEEEEEEGNLKKLHLACAIGYTVEKEPKYTVKIKGKIEENLLVYGWGIKRYFFARTYNDSSKRGEHTRKELEEDGFGWVFDCSGIEIEEVE